MGILPTSDAANKTPRVHDPEVCGLSFATDCDECRAAQIAEQREQYRRDAEARARARRREIIERLAIAAGCRPEELVELLSDIALQAQGADA